MKKILYKIWLYILRSGVFLKRGLFFGIKKIFSFFRFLRRIYINTLGYRLYALGGRIYRRVQSIKVNTGTYFIHFFGRRFVLQIVFFVIFLGILFPYSQLYTRQSTSIVGHDTLLYELSGVADQDFAIDEQIQNSYLLSVNPYQGTDFFMISEDGASIIKPIIIPGADVTEFFTQNENPQNPDSSNAPVIPSGPRNEVVEYTVQAGDVLGGISTNFGIKLETLLWANGLTSASRIRPGDILTIPPTDGVLHVVKRGETIGQIANIYEAESEKIIAFNNLGEGAQISIGQQLMIPEGRKPYTAPARPTVVTPPAAASNPVAQITAPRPSTTPSSSGFIWPTDATIITQYFGFRHTGVDIAGKAGLNNYASKDGKVIVSEFNTGGYGYYVILDHGDGVQTLYAHHSSNVVSVGQYVKQGQVVGILGSTGRSTGPHLHFEVRINGQRVNPFQYIRR